MMVIVLSPPNLAQLEYKHRKSSTARPNIQNKSHASIPPQKPGSLWNRKCKYRPMVYCSSNPIPFISQLKKTLGKHRKLFKFAQKEAEPETAEAAVKRARTEQQRIKYLSNNSSFALNLSKDGCVYKHGRFLFSYWYILSVLNNISGTVNQSKSLN